MKIARSAAISIATVAVALAPTAAEAATYHHSDAAHDVVSVNDDTGATTPAPDRASGDILTSGVAYGPRRVTMAMKYAAFDKTDGITEHLFSLATSKGKVRTFAVIASSGHLEGSMLKVTGRGKSFKCKGVHWSLGYGARTATVSVPVRCLGKPRWVRASMLDLAVDDLQSDNPPLVLDDANATGFTQDSTPRYGPRVYR
jgi:hypothetical protein